ncbi:hypothetical protein CSC43_0002 [Pseudomonas aeruginosa]|nr:hypothetical protein CSC43_0002 [Pseudomonas aeruginosa]
MQALVLREQFRQQYLPLLTACAAIHARLSSWRICNRCKTSAARSRSTRACALATWASRLACWALPA